MNNIETSDLNMFKELSFKRSKMYRVLFCKDEYFVSEKEYRFVINSKIKDLPKEYKINTLSKITLKSIDEL